MTPAGRARVARGFGAAGLVRAIRDHAGGARLLGAGIRGRQAGRSNPGMTPGRLVCAARALAAAGPDDREGPPDGLSRRWRVGAARQAGVIRG